MPAGEDVAPSAAKLPSGRGIDAIHGDSDKIESEPETIADEAETADDEEADLLKRVEQLFSSPKDFGLLTDALTRDCPSSAHGEVRSAWRAAMAIGCEEGESGGRVGDLHPREEKIDSRSDRVGAQPRDGPAMRRPPLVRNPSSSPPPPPLLKAPGGPRGPLARQDSQAPSLPSAPSTPRCPREATGNMMPSYTPPSRADIIGGISTPESSSPPRPGPLHADGKILPTPAGCGTEVPSAEKGGRAGKKQSFRVARLGVPSPRRAGLARQPPECAPEPRDQGSAVSYIHIPRHSLQDFQSFARSVAAEARRETATDNPYVQALRKHRAELQTYSVIPSPMEEPSLEQQMSTEREALSLITPIMRPVDLSTRPSASARVSTSWPGDDEQVHGAGCISWRCCATDQAPWMLQVDSQLRTVEAASPPRSARSPLSARRRYVVEREESLLDYYATGL